MQIVDERPGLVPANGAALLGRMPSAVGYQPTLAEEMGRLQERITSTKTGSITSIQAVYVPADDLTDPSPATTFAHLDATVVLSRQIAQLGIYPAIDPLDSTSRQLDPLVIGQEHYDTARGVQAVLVWCNPIEDGRRRGPAAAQPALGLVHESPHGLHGGRVVPRGRRRTHRKRAATAGRLADFPTFASVVGWGAGGGGSVTARLPSGIS